MNSKESFLDSVKQQYVNEIQDAYAECESVGGRDVDYAKLGKLLKKLKAQAKVEGISVAEFEELVECTLPGIWEKTGFKQPLKKVA